jgi:hypothetical protein
MAGDRAGEVAQQVTTAVRAVVGSEHPDTVRAALADPQHAADLLMELGRIEREHEAEMMRLTLADVAGARAQTAELVRASSPMAWGAPGVTCVVLLLFAAVVLGPMFGLPAPSDATVRLLEYCLIAAVGYWLGSSAGSARKDEALRGPLAQAVRK